MTESLHEKYVPILHFAKGERFYPMAVDDFLGYCTLWAKGGHTPLVAQGQVTPDMLARTYQRRSNVYVQSVPASLTDQNVAARWGADVLLTLADISDTASHWKEEVAKVAYRWFSAKTRSATRLFWWSDLIMSVVGAGGHSHEDLPRLDLPPEIRQAAFESYARSQPRKPNYTYYYRTARDGNYLYLQYWFFYGYNDWATGFGGMNDHEGDWEGLYIFFDLDAYGQPKEPPAYVTFVGHHSRLTKPWFHHDVTLVGNHPVGYVAAGSHATYPESREYELMKIFRLVDYAAGDGLTIEPGDWQRCEDLNTQPWALAFLGSWGTRYWLPPDWAQSVLGTVSRKLQEVGLPGVSAPTGPRFTEEGAERPNWLRAVSWAGISELERT